MEEEFPFWWFAGWQPPAWPGSDAGRHPCSQLRAQEVVPAAVQRQEKAASFHVLAAALDATSGQRKPPNLGDKVEKEFTAGVLGVPQRQRED